MNKYEIGLKESSSVNIESKLDIYELLDMLYNINHKNIPYIIDTKDEEIFVPSSAIVYVRRIKKY